MAERNEGLERLEESLRANGLGRNMLNPYDPSNWTTDRRGSLRRLPTPLWVLGGVLFGLIVVVPVIAVLTSEVF